MQIGGPTGVAFDHSPTEPAPPEPAAALIRKNVHFIVFTTKASQLEAPFL